MRRIFIILLLFIFSVFAIPIIFTNTNIVNGKSNENNNETKIYSINTTKEVNDKNANKKINLKYD